ncbi:MAG: lytic transglycosylase domain-containing protein [Hyphomicrobiaceae bacterium]
MGHSTGSRQIAPIARLCALAPIALLLVASADGTAAETGTKAKASKAGAYVVAQAGATKSPAAPAKARPAASRVVATPSPGDAAEEAAHIKRYDAAIAPVRDRTPSAADIDNLKAAIARAAARDDAGSRGARDNISDKPVRKLAEWYRLRAGLGTVTDYRGFLSANPQWPSRSLLKRRMEEILFREGGRSTDIKAIFKEDAPESAAGHAALASAYLAEGHAEAARRHAAIAWRQYDLPAPLEPVFLERFGKLLTAADHKWRLDRLLIDEPRWSAERSERAAVARRVLPLLSAAERKKAEARLAVFLRSKNATALLVGVANTKDKDWGLEYHRIQNLRRHLKVQEAAKRLIAVPVDKDLIVAPDEWWAERRAVAYGLLRSGKFRLAYDVVKEAGALSANPQKDQAFLAGWLALQYLENPKLAEKHFATMRKAADGPLSSAKGAYWLARSIEGQGRRSEAMEHYKDAARFTDTFHGQLALVRLRSGKAQMSVTMPAAPTQAEIEAFRGNELAHAVVAAHRAGLDGLITRTLLTRLSLNQKSEAAVAMVAHLARSIDDTQMSVRIGKSGVARGFNLIVYSYPVHAFPTFTPLRKPPEMALLLGVARQESEFNTAIKSGAGARGILQVMPITARHVCRDYKIKCDIGRLMTDEAYNAMLGSAYIADRMEEFQGSYVLGIAGYNAGPGRACQWVRQFGNPRDTRVDVIDWIHRIPFEETRDYVQKVLSNVQVYRARLADGPVRIALDDDLTRARQSAAKAPSSRGALQSVCVRRSGRGAD